MNNIFRVRWTKFWKSLTRYLWVATLVPIGVLLALRYVGTGFNYARTFENASPSGLALIALALLVFMPVFALLMALFLRKASVTVSNDTVQGINYWGRKKRIPLQDIAAFSIFRSNGVNALVVKSQAHGKIYISDHTERLEELLALLSSSVSEPLQAKFAALPWHHFAGHRFKA